MRTCTPTRRRRSVSLPRPITDRLGVPVVALPACEPPVPANRDHLVAAGVVAVSVVAVLAYVWVGCPLGLAPDEAHYWDWSRRLDWSYYSKGPLVAWLIRGSCELFGPLSVAVTGDLTAAVRLPAAACHAALLAAWYVLAAGVFRSPRVGLAVVALAASLPLVRAGAVLMTIDPPFLAWWAWALVCVWKAIDNRSLAVAARTAMASRDRQRAVSLRTEWWVAAGVCVALGTLAKYTMALFPAAVVGFLLFHRRSEFRRPGVWLFLALAAAGWVPVVVWNAQHDWVSFRHVSGQVGTTGGGVRWLGPLAFVLGQAAVMVVVWLVAFLVAAVRYRPTVEGDPGVRLLWWCSVPVWGVFAVAALAKPGQPNWPAPAYVGGLVLAVAWVRERLIGPHRRLVAWSVGAGVVIGFAAVAATHFPAAVRPTLAAVAGSPTEADPTPIRNLDVTARLSGWQTLAAEVDRIRGRLGPDAVLAATHWTYPGQLRFHCVGHPDVYAVGVANRSDRHSQYDLWRPNPVADAQVFLGRTFVIVGDIGPEAAAAFESVELPVKVVHAEDGVPVAAWTIWVCHGFRGFPADAATHDPGY